MKKVIAVFSVFFPVAGFAMGDTHTPIYGRPTLYGEYEISATDARRAAVMYGAVPKNVAEKMPVKPKKVMPKKAVKKKKAPVKKTDAVQSVPSVEKEVASDVIVVPARVAHDDVVQDASDVMPPAKTETSPTPAPAALAIAAATTSDVPTLESFCTRRAPRGTGDLPDGFILMPGRPDLMSCSDK